MSSKNNELKAGVILSFDDYFVTEWFNLHKLMTPFNWKANFFVSNQTKLNVEDYEKLIALQDYGHEIGGHGFEHIEAPSYQKKNGSSNYLNKEIIPMLSAFEQNKINIKSFAYPYGTRSLATDKLLLNKFNILRGTTLSYAFPSLNKCFFNNKKIVYGLGIDHHYRHFSLTYILNLLKYAFNKHKILILYAHKPVLKVQNKYEVAYHTIQEICSFINKNNMTFFVFNDLHPKIKTISSI